MHNDEKFQGLSCEDVTLTFINPWRSMLKETIGSFDEAVRRVSLSSLGDLEKLSTLLDLQKLALEKLGIFENSLKEFAELITEIEEKSKNESSRSSYFQIKPVLQATYFQEAGSEG
jgi:hypothetical protein